MFTYAFVLAGTLALSWIVLHCFVTPLSMARFYRKQGIRGTPFTPVVGDIPRIVKARKMENGFVEAWRMLEEVSSKNVGYSFLGPELRLRVRDLELVRAILATHADAFHKPSLMVDSC